MGRNAKASSSRLPTTKGLQDKVGKKSISRKPEVEPASESEEESEDDLLEAEVEEEAEGIAQYAPDDWDGEDQSGNGSGSGNDQSDSDAGSGSESEDDDNGQEDLRKLQENLRSMPLSTLMKAQRSLNPTEEESDSDTEAGARPNTIKAKRLAEAKKRLAEMQRRKGKAGAVPRIGDLEDEEGSEDEFEDMRRSKNGGEERVRKEKVKRDNKHAPTAMSTKKQVSRTRQVVEGMPKNDRRDPRFDTMSSSSIDPHLASQSYSFLPKILKDDLSALRTAVQMAQKAERTCPLSQKPAKVAEREMLELQLGKLRTKIERGEREAKEREVLAGAKREENSKRKEGKGAWYMKKNEQKELLLKARFEHLNEQGGQRAVKKAIEKKRKKTASKEKKSRPFARGAGGGAAAGGGAGAGASAGEGGEGVKRRRVA